MSSSSTSPTSAAPSATPERGTTPAAPRHGHAVAAAVGLCGLIAGLFPIFESDLFWHLATGRWMVAHGAWPRVDPFRFTGGEAGGLAWVDHEWLFQLVVYGAERLVGLDGLIVLRALALGGFALLLFVACRRGRVGPGLAGLLALAAMLGVRPRFLVRPEIVTLFALVLLLLLLDTHFRDRRESGRQDKDKDFLLKERQRHGGGRWGPGWWVWLVGLVVVWVNCHGQALLAPGVAGLFLLGTALERWRYARGGAEPLSWRWVLGVPALLGAALLAQPYGWRLIEVPLGIGRALAGLSAYNPEWMSSLAAPQPFLYGGFATVAGLALAARFGSPARRWAAPAWGLPTAAMALLALSGVRHQALFFVLAAPYAARCLALFPEARIGQGVGGAEAGTAAGRRERGLAVAAVVGAVALAVWCAVPPAGGLLRARHGGLQLGFGLAEGRFPVRMAGVLAERPAIGPLYNEFVHGGYLLWRLHPPRQVFVDGRMELEPGLLAEIAAARRDPVAWERFLLARGAVGALVRYEPRRVPVYEPDPAAPGGLRRAGESTANALLFPPERWALVDWDDETMLFLHRERGREQLADWGDDAPYRFIQPEDVFATLARAAADPLYADGLRAELDRKLAADPTCRRARWFRAQLQ